MLAWQLGRLLPPPLLPAKEQGQPLGLLRVPQLPRVVLTIRDPLLALI